MPDYKSMYFKLAAQVADAVELLTEAQQQGENSYIENTDEPTEVSESVNSHQEL